MKGHEFTFEELDDLLFAGVVALIPQTNPKINQGTAFLIQAKALTILKSARKAMRRSTDELGPCGYDAFIRAMDLAKEYAQQLARLELSDPAQMQLANDMLYGAEPTTETAVNLIDQAIDHNKKKR